MTGWILWTLCLTLPILAAATSATFIGGTPHLREIFLGRCWQYQQQYPDAFDELVDCDVFGVSFSSAWLNKNPCYVQPQDYYEYTQIARQKPPPDTGLLWHDVHALVSKYTAVDDTALAGNSLLTSYVADGITWCSNVPGSLESYDNTCSYDYKCTRTPESSFWAITSLLLATSFEGEVKLILNGSSGQAYCNNCSIILSDFEIPNLNPAKVTAVVVWLIHDSPTGEYCGEGSLILLEKDVKERGIPYRCIDDPLPIRHLLCVSNADSPQCQLAHDTWIV